MNSPVPQSLYSQSNSSVPSPQSSSWSHLQVLKIHLPFAHLKETKKLSNHRVPVLFDEFFWHLICHFALIAPFFHSNNRWRFNRFMAKVDKFLFILFKWSIFQYIYCYSKLLYRLVWNLYRILLIYENVIIGKFSSSIYPSLLQNRILNLVSI